MNVPCECVMCTRSIEVRIFNPVYMFKKEILLIGLDLEYSLFVYLKCLLRGYEIYYD